MSQKTRAVCRRCGSETVGKFCGECGEPTQAKCPSCGHPAPSGAKFCQECGAALSGGPGAERAPGDSVRNVDPTWVLVGAIGVALAIAAVFLLLDRQERAGTSAATSTAAAPSPGAASPRRVAETLYNQVMMASENGDRARARQLAPDALRAYESLGPHDEDGRYHIGLLQLTAGDLESASEQVRAIEASVPDHLLGILLAHAVAPESKDDAAASAATRKFIEVYETQMATGRNEYAEHRVGIERFAERARSISP